MARLEKIPVGVLGATGMVGQRYVSLLEGHPWFSLSFLAASSSSAGRTYREAVAGRWHAPGELPENAGNVVVQDVSDIAQVRRTCALVFSALDTDAAEQYEGQYAEAGLPVVSNASAHRNDPDVPLLIPEINAAHLSIISMQQKKRRWGRGFIVVKPNCSLQSYLLPLFALHEAFRISEVMVTTLQAVSGAGHPGVASLDIMDNVVLFIKGEEEKTEREPLKILGNLEGSAVVPAAGIRISAHCNRVPVLDGHLACVSARFRRKPTREQVLQAWVRFQAEPQRLKLPSAPVRPIVYRDEPDRPQPRLDRDAEAGMAITVGRLRDCSVLDYRFVGLSHNTLRGAAGGGILNAELLVAKGFIPRDR